MSILENGFVAFDTETTGVDVEQDRIVTAFAGMMTPDGFFDPERQHHVLIDPTTGPDPREIPAAAEAVHGISTARAKAEGVASHEAISTLSFIIRLECITNGKPLVIFNAPFDTTILSAELRRHGLPPIAWDKITIIDPLVIDKALYKYRRGSGMRKLTAIAEAIYDVPLETNAHDASADCLMAGRVAIRQMQRRDPSGPARKLGEASGTDLNWMQKQWHAQQSEGYAAWRRSPKAGAQQDVNFRAQQGWPVRPLQIDDSEACEPTTEEQAA